MSLLLTRYANMTLFLCTVASWFLHLHDRRRIDVDQNENYAVAHNWRESHPVHGGMLGLDRVDAEGYFLKTPARERSALPQFHRRLYPSLRSLRRSLRLSRSLRMILVPMFDSISTFFFLNHLLFVSPLSKVGFN